MNFEHLPTILGKIDGTFKSMNHSGVKLLKDYSGTYPLNGDIVSEDKLSFEIVPATKTGLRVQSIATDRLIYNKTSNQQARITFSTENIAKIVPVLQKKLLNSYQPTAWSTIIESPQSTGVNPAVTNPLTIQFKNQLDETLNGEYRIVFQAMGKQMTRNHSMEYLGRSLFGTH